MSLKTKLSSKSMSLALFSTDASSTTMTLSENSSVSSMENSPRAVRMNQKDISLRGHSKTDKSQKFSKVCTQLSKINSSRAPELLARYHEKNTIYKNEEFTQQACSFIAKIASDVEIPREIKGNCSLYYILVSIAKIFMLNEYELTMLACLLDHCDWSYEKIVREEEESFLKEFPCSLEVEITKDNRKLIIYLLILTFALKMNLNEKSDMEMIQAYCEKICKNFSDLLKRSSKIFSSQLFNFSPLEINNKFRNLSKKDNKEPFMKIVKDYNMVVESILRLTGSHTVKPKVRSPENHSPKASQRTKKTEESHNSHTEESTPDTDVFYADFNNHPEAYLNMPLHFSRQASSEVCEDFNNECKREANLDIYQEEEQDSLANKKIHGEEIFSFLQQESEQQDFFKNGPDSPFIDIAKQYESEDIFAAIDFNRKPSTMSNQMNDEIPSFSRFNSNFSLFGNK